MSCDCIDAINKGLESGNAELDLPLQVNTKTGELAFSTRVTIRLVKLLKRGPRLPVLFATYCPFCGRPYNEENPKQ